ncbi:39S ribosomal mitochondrial [Brachionus plicatilis]|uniref:Large ribosomal subunit protein bL17m n=1 Tax=Brachionus plicatilis TaxID=10195 RepID=A0A3M7QAD3_BRAPC|nr:39S ribosomal mitochondrial [Brachionus plicatilis]
MSNLTAGKLLIPYSRLARKKITKFTGPQGRIDKIRGIISDLLRLERIEIPNFVGYESRQYAERLIDLAKKYGDKHEGMMEMADYWIIEKDLIPKLFQVIVPRYENKLGPYTQVFKLPEEYPGKGIKNICMELKDNALPPIQAAMSNRTHNNSLTNILIDAYKKDYKFRTEQNKFN